jgi:hypothetical protein
MCILCVQWRNVSLEVALSRACADHVLLTYLPPNPPFVRYPGKWWGQIQLLKMNETSGNNLLLVTEDFKRSRTNRESCHRHGDWSDWKLHLRLEEIERSLTSGFSCAESKLVWGRRKAFFIFKWVVVDWLCGIKWNVSAEGTRNCERNWNPGLQCKPRLIA